MKWELRKYLRVKYSITLPPSFQTVMEYQKWSVDYFFLKRLRVLQELGYVWWKKWPGLLKLWNLNIIWMEDKFNLQIPHVSDCTKFNSYENS